MPIVGDVLADRYRIEGVLGAGGMASVYRATDVRLERQVAVKVLLPNLARDASLAGRFDREARMLAAVAHPNVAAIFDVEPGDGETGREPFYVMELCDGGSLSDRIAASGAVDPEKLVPVVGAIADGLAELHRSGVIHRDVKPGNILFAGVKGKSPNGSSDMGRPKLADFGIAKADGGPEATTLTAPGTMVGTLPYLAPELLADGEPTTASDVYALGATTFHALTGELPKPFASLARFSDARATPAPLASSVRRELGGAFDAPLAAALAIDPSARPTPTELAQRLAESLEVHRAQASNPRPDTAGGAAVMPATAGAAMARDATAGTAMAAAAFAPNLARPGPPTLVLPNPPAAERPTQPAAGPAPVPAPSPKRTPATRRGRSGTSRTSAALRRNPAAIVAAGVMIAIVALLASVGLRGNGGSLIGTAGSPGLGASASASPAASGSPNPAASALQALQSVVAAIDQARGGKDGLGGGDAHDLQALASTVRSALNSGDFSAARDAAGTLADQASSDAENVDPARRDALLGAIHDLQAAIATLQSSNPGD